MNVLTHACTLCTVYMHACNILILILKHSSYELTKTSPLAIFLQVFYSKLKTLLFHKSYPDSCSSPHLPHHFSSKPLLNHLTVCLPDPLGFGPSRLIWL